MSKQQVINYWKESAKESALIARDVAKKHPDWAFFFWHLTIEKTLKALIVKSGKTPQPIHDLVRLTKSAKISLISKHESQLEEISTYAISARYDDYKRSFYKKVNKTAYKSKWLIVCEEIYLWLGKQL